jgi:hypothetical protein
MTTRRSPQAFLEATIITAKLIKIEQAVQGFNAILEDLKLTPGKVLVAEKIRVIEEARLKSS